MDAPTPEVGSPSPPVRDHCNDDAAAPRPLGESAAATQTAFFSRLFDPQMRSAPTSPATTWRATGGAKHSRGPTLIVAGPLATPAARPAYVGVDDVYVMTQRAAEWGGVVLQTVTELGDAGWISIVQAPSGDVVTMWQGRDA